MPRLQPSKLQPWCITCKVAQPLVQFSRAARHMTHLRLQLHAVEVEGQDIEVAVEAGVLTLLRHAAGRLIQHARPAHPVVLIQHLQGNCDTSLQGAVLSVKHMKDQSDPFARWQANSMKQLASTDSMVKESESEYPSVS